MSEFFRELNEKQKQKSCCSCQLLLGVFVVILALLLGGLWYFIYQAKQKIVLPEKFVFSQPVNLQEKVDEAVARGEPEITIFVSEKELNQVLVETTGNQNFRIRIDPEGIICYSQFKNLKGTTAIIEMQPEIKNNKLQLKITKLSASRARLPRWLTFLVSSKLPGLVLIDGTQSGKIELTDAQLQVGGILVRAKVIGR